MSGVMMKVITNKKTVLLVAVIILTATCGTWLLLSPSRERQTLESSQDALMQEILAEISLSHESDLIHLVYHYEPISQPPIETVTHNYETESLEVEYEHQDEYQALYEPQYGEYEAYFFEPLPDYIFPSAIHGIGILSIERINLLLPIAEGVEYATLRIAPARVPQTAQIGETGNAVIAGHRNYTFGSMFNRLDELEIGDTIGFQARNGEEMLFTVFEIAVIEPHDQIAFIQPVNDSIITLYTCTPIRTATHRLIIRAQRTY